MQEAKDFLTDSLNLPWVVTYPDHRPVFNVWLRRWHRWFTYVTQTEPQRITGEPSLRQILNGKADVEPSDSAEPPKWEPVQVPREQLERFAPKLRTALRKIWYEKDQRQRDWYFYRLRDEYHRMIVRAKNPDLIELTAPDALDQMVRLEELAKARGDDPIQRARLF